MWKHLILPQFYPYHSIYLHHYFVNVITQNNTPATFDSTTFTSLPVTSTPSSIPIAIGTSGVPLDFTILIAADNHQLWITSLKGT